MSSKIVKSEAGDEPEEQPEAGGPEDDKPMTFWEHIEELRRRLVWALLWLFAGCIVSWYFKKDILDFISKPFYDAWEHEHVAGTPSLNFDSPGAPFTALIKLSLIGGAALSAPFLFYQLWSFIAPGLYSKEKKYVIPFAVVSSGLFVGGSWFGYLAAFPLTFGYFLSFAGDIGGDKSVRIVPTVMMEKYIDFVMQMLLGFGIVFEIPIVLTFLAIIGVVNHRMLLGFTRYYIFIAFVASAILSPPDVTSMIVMAIPACLLYFASIALVYVFQKPEFRLESEESKKAKALKEAEANAKKAAAQAEKVAPKASRPSAKASVFDASVSNDAVSDAELPKKKKKKKKKPTTDE